MNIVASIAALPSRSWSQVRAEKDRQFQIKMAIQQQESQQNKILQDEVNQMKLFADKVKALPVLDPDKRRIAGKFETLLGDVRNRIETDFGGDTIAWLKNGFQQDFDDLANKISNSDELSIAEKNKEFYALYQADKQKADHTMRMINTGIPGSDGKPIFISADAAVSRFMNGESDRISYSGSYKTPTKWAKVIRDTYAPNGVIDQSVPATLDEKYAAMISEDGMDERDIADYNMQSRFADAPVYHKFEPIQAENLKIAKQRLNLANKSLEYRMVIDKLRLSKMKEEERTMDATQAFNLDMIPENKSLSYDAGMSVSPTGQKFIKTRVGAVPIPKDYIRNVIDAYGINFKEDGSINPTQPLQVKFLNGQDELMPPEALKNMRYTGNMIKLTGYSPGENGKLKGYQNGYGIEVTFDLPETYAESIINKSTGDRFEGTIGTSLPEGVIKNGQGAFGWMLGAFQPNGNTYRSKAIIDISDMNDVQRAFVSKKSKIKESDTMNGVDALSLYKDYFSGSQATMEETDLDN